MTHTPGPYAYRPNSYDDWGSVRNSNGLLVCLARCGRNLTQKEIDEYRINGTDPYEDNGHLFTAAPDMKLALEHVRDGHTDMDEIVAAIAKAEGRTA